jgi:PEP-CTERM motif
MRRIIIPLAIFSILLVSNELKAGIVVPGSTVEGKTIAAWTGDWWNWLVKEGFATNPANDPTGAFANLNQTEPIFFVAGGFGDSTPVVRNFTVPTNKYLLVPIINYVFWVPEDGADEAAVRALSKSNVDSVTNLRFEFDGSLLANPQSHREASPAGGFQLNYGPLLREIGLSNMPRLSVSDGYWVMLEPLTAGNHTMRISAQQPGQFTSNLTLNLTAVPEPSSLLLAVGGLACFALRRKR